MLELVSVEYLGKRVDCRVLKDDWWFDKEAIGAAGVRKFFTTKTGKTELLDYKFDGVDSLVPANHLAEIKGILITPLGVVDASTWVALIDDAGYRMKSDNVTIDENNVRFVTGGLQPQSVDNTGVADLFVPGNKAHDNIRIYTTKRVIRGGAVFAFEYITRTAVEPAAPVLVALYGRELIPVSQATWRKLTRKLQEAIKA